MAISVPIPNQPLYTWQPTFAVINVHGSVINTGRLSRQPGYGRVIMGTQTLAPIPVFYVGMTHKGRIFIHGYHLPHHTVLGATRYRILIIVQIWNVIVTGIKVVATLIDSVAKINVTSDASYEAGALYTTYMRLGGEEVEREIKLAFTIENIKRFIHLMLSNPGPITRRLWLSAREVNSRLAKRLWLSAHPPVAKINKLWLSAAVRKGTVERVHKLSARVRTAVLNRAHKLQARIHRIEQRRIKLAAYIRHMFHERIVKLSVRTNDVWLSRVVKLSAQVVNPKIERIIKLSAKVVNPVLEAVMSYLVSRVHGYSAEQTVKVRTSSAIIAERSPTVSINTAQRVQTGSIQTSLFNHVSKKLSTAFKITQSQFKKVMEFKLGSSKLKSMLAFRGPTSKKSTQIQAHLSSAYIRKGLALIAHVHYADFVAIVEFEAMSSIGHALLQFRPVSANQVRTLMVMVTLCKTELMAYLSFVPHELIQDLDVLISTCTHMTTSVLQWYLHGGRVSNEGYGNEIVFDLGEVPIYGPIPPAPSRQWEGGYVEDPFKGVGYVPASNSTGYGSPSVNDWIANAKMFWDSPTEPFTGGTP